MEKALDISRWQSTLDAEKARAAGITTILCRACYGTGKDARWDAFAPAVKAAGLRLGAYGFATWHYKSANGGSAGAARAAMRAQTDALIALAAAAGANSWVAIDQELESGQALGLTAADNTALLAEACGRIRAAGLHPCVYCSAGWAAAHIDPAALGAPLWVAWYYADPNDPDFDGCAPLAALPGKWGDYLRGLGDKLCGWQFGRIGCGEKYGVGSANVDRDWICFQPGEKEERPVYTSDTLRIGPASAGDRKTLTALAESLAVAVRQEGDCLLVGPLSAGDIATISGRALALGLPCADYAPPQEEAPAGDPPEGELAAALAEALAALARLETGQTDLGRQLAALRARLAAAGAALVGEVAADG